MKMRKTEVEFWKKVVYDIELKTVLLILHTECNSHGDKCELSISEIKWGYLDFLYFWGCKKIEKINWYSNHRCLTTRPLTSALSLKEINTQIIYGNTFRPNKLFCKLSYLYTVSS